MNRFHKGLAVLGVIGTFLILLMGALVTKTGSQAGCGNTWPFCHGEVFPSYHTLELWIEYSHRIVAGLVGLIVLILSVWSWRDYPDNGKMKLFAFSSSFFVVLQGLIGAAAVVWGQSDAVLALHFGFSLLSFSSVVLLLILLLQMDEKQRGRPNQGDTAVTPKMKAAIWGLAVYTYIVVYTGAYVRHTGSSLGCTDWPLCGGQWIPDMTSQVGIQLTHRLFAGLLLFFTIWLLWAIKKHHPNRKDLIRGAWWSVVLILLQVVTGGAIVLTKLELMIALIHAALVSAYFSALCYLCMQVGPPWKKRTDMKAKPQLSQ
ncbi:COX15/CtaA family protein [Melghirimyces algeriensis]|uniref:Heme A synthase n=1 Tax=Melghirimyces algeriensis TaxID=910412 RepID=A0A521B264_9BACL|nr:heme A synthase [Melghirimyces algeriensis]SMO41192.1 cytochrome c oxidase assembly protein subunit 15 [Melghirimyces algeriensis]